jgi:hypothetical protein
MEHPFIREGATVLLPVRARGATLYLGDGHAAQGDGELTGDAMETSRDVTFSVDIQRWGFDDIARVEDNGQIMSVGVGGSLDEAMRRRGCRSRRCHRVRASRHRGGVSRRRVRRGGTLPSVLRFVRGEARGGPLLRERIQRDAGA